MTQNDSLDVSAAGLFFTAEHWVLGLENMPGVAIGISTPACTSAPIFTSLSDSSESGLISGGPCARAANIH